VRRRLVGQVIWGVVFVALAAFFALVGLALVMSITGFGVVTAHCVPGARSVRGFTPMVGGGEMASRFCALEGPVGLWPWPVVSVVAGAVLGGIFAAGLLHIFRSGLGFLRRWGKNRPRLGYPVP